MQDQMHKFKILRRAKYFLPPIYIIFWQTVSQYTADRRTVVLYIY